LDVHYRHVDTSSAGRAAERWMGDSSTAVGKAGIF